MEFEDYIELKIRTSLEANRKQGKRRDMSLLTDILSLLFWARTSLDRGINDIQPRLCHKYKNLKRDTMEDNLGFLSSIGTPPFLKITKERDGSKRGEITIYNDLLANIDRIEECILHSPGECGRPRNLYSLDNYYVEDYFSKCVQLEVGIKAAIRCRKGIIDDAECHPSTCLIDDCKKAREAKKLAAAAKRDDNPPS